MSTITSLIGTGLDSVTEYCDANQLTHQQRLELFLPVCQAIQHAHQKGIIHRDIKPSNILVTLYDDKPVPKVIDFGVAKAMEQRLTEAITCSTAVRWKSPRRRSMIAGPSILSAVNSWRMLT